MGRCYLVGNRVAGFGEQHVNALYPAAPGADTRSALEPGQRLYFPPTRADLQALREKMETEWLGELCRLVGLDRARLSVIWAAVVLYGPQNGRAWCGVRV